MDKPNKTGMNFSKLQRLEESARKAQARLDQLNAEWDAERERIEKEWPKAWAGYCEAKDLNPHYDFGDVLC